MSVMVIVGALLAVLVLAALLVCRMGERRFWAQVDAERAQWLASAATTASLEAFRSPLPPVLGRYLEHSGAHGRAPLRRVMLRQRGSLWIGPGRPLPFEAEQLYDLQDPSFLWSARVRMAPGLALLVRDRFLAGRGLMQVQLAGVVPLVDAAGPELDQGAGLRFWGEVIAFPEMISDPRIQWEALGDRRARMLLRQGAFDLSAIVEFGDGGFPVAVHAERYRSVGKEMVLTPWTGTFEDWEPLDGRPFPTRWRSVWNLEEGDMVAVEMEILALVAVEG